MQLNWTNLKELTVTGISNIRTISGVYRLSYLDPNDQKYHVYYVGQAENLKGRLTDHLSGNEVNPCCSRHLQSYNCYFKAAAVSRKADRDGAEAALYNHFNPTCPERVPNVTPLDINFD